MVGYVENLTDPSYRGQILVRTEFNVCSCAGVLRQYPSRSLHTPCSETTVCHILHQMRSVCPPEWRVTVSRLVNWGMHRISPAGSDTLHIRSRLSFAKIIVTSRPIGTREKHYLRYVASARARSQSVWCALRATEDWGGSGSRKTACRPCTASTRVLSPRSSAFTVDLTSYWQSTVLCLLDFSVHDRQPRWRVAEAC